MNPCSTPVNGFPSQYGADWLAPRWGVKGTVSCTETWQGRVSSKARGRDPALRPCFWTSGPCLQYGRGAGMVFCLQWTGCQKRWPGRRVWRTGIRRTQAEAKSKAQSCLSPAFVWVGASLWSMRPPRLSCSYHLVPYQSHVLKGPRRSRG